MCYIQVSGLVLKLLGSAALHCQCTHPLQLTGWFKWAQGTLSISPLLSVATHPAYKCQEAAVVHSRQFSWNGWQVGSICLSDPDSPRIPHYSLHPLPCPVTSLPYPSHSYPCTYKPYSSTLPRPHIPASTVYSSVWGIGPCSSRIYVYREKKWKIQWKIHCVIFPFVLNSKQVLGQSRSAS